MNLLIREEQEQDHDAVHRLHQRAFGQDAEARLVDRLRTGGFVSVSLVAQQRDLVVGHVLFSDLSIVAADRSTPALALAPVAVLPGLQRQGIGSALIRRGLEVCRERGHTIVVVLGDPRFYVRFGFSAALATRLESPYAGEAFQAAELVAGALKDVVGKVTHAPPFLEL